MIENVPDLIGMTRYGLQVCTVYFQLPSLIFLSIYFVKPHALSAVKQRIEIPGLYANGVDQADPPS